MNTFANLDTNLRKHIGSLGRIGSPAMIYGQSTSQHAKPSNLPCITHLTHKMRFDEFLSASLSGNWATVEELKHYWHEAGHAVIARLGNFSVDWVSTDEGFLSADSTELGRFKGSQAACMTISSHLISPILNKRQTPNKRERELLVAYATHVLAGPYIEYIIDRKFFDKECSANDYRQVSFVLSKSGLSKVAIANMWRTVFRNLRPMIMENFHSIARVAFTLYPNQTIYSNELDALIAQASLDMQTTDDALSKATA